MPSIFARHRRASESLPNGAMSPQDDSAMRQKRRSMDVGRPPVSGNKFKSLFAQSGPEGEGRRSTERRRSSVASQLFGGDDEEGRNGSLRKKLTSASQIFHKHHAEATPSPSSPRTPTTPPAPNGASLRLDAPTPRSPNSNAQFISPTLRPETFGLSATASPEGRSRDGPSGWQPSYPVILPDDSYADLAPDGLPATDRAVPSSPILPSENEHRRSLHANIPTPSPDEPPSKPVTPPVGPAPLPTPPPSASAPHRELPTMATLGSGVEKGENTPTSTSLASEEQSLAGQTVSASASSNSTGRPLLSVVTSSDATPSETLSQGPVASPGPTTAVGGTPTSAKPNGRPRPDVPPRRTTLIQSPPMPQPIKNLPSMVGWPAFMKDGVPGTPSWGQNVPRTPGWSGGNAPKTPGWSGMASPVSARPPTTPGGGFPFTLPPTPVGQNKGKGKEPMSEEELRKARRAMVCTLEYVAKIST